MSPRKYQLGKRAAAVVETRARIVEAARVVFAGDGFHRGAVDEVARRADVSRATVYYQFGSKLGLIDAVLDDIERRGEQERIVAAGQLPDALEAVRRAFKEGSRYWAVDHVLVAKLIGLAAADPATRELVQRRDQNRIGLLRRLAGRLAEGQHLRDDCSLEQAIQTLWSEQS